MKQYVILIDDEPVEAFTRFNDLDAYLAKLVGTNAAGDMMADMTFEGVGKKGMADGRVVAVVKGMV